MYGKLVMSVEQLEIGSGVVWIHYNREGLVSDFRHVVVAIDHEAEQVELLWIAGWRSRGIITGELASFESLGFGTGAIEPGRDRLYIPENFLFEKEDFRELLALRANRRR